MPAMKPLSRSAIRQLVQGQAAVEYAVVAAGLAAALFVVEFEGKTAAQYFAAAVRAFFENLSFFLSLP
jgi:hypothetical protein